MDALLLIFSLHRILWIFTGFTFTDVEDFMPLISLFVGFAGVIVVDKSPQRKASLPLLALLFLLSLWPLLPNIGLYFLARELQKFAGHWPQIMVDDPKNWLGNVSPIYDALFHLVNYLEAFSGAWMVVWTALFFAVKARLSPKLRRACAGAVCLALLLTLFDPGNLYAWWMD